MGHVALSAGWGERVPSAVLGEASSPNQIVFEGSGGMPTAPDEGAAVAGAGAGVGANWPTSGDLGRRRVVAFLVFLAGAPLAALDLLQAGGALRELLLILLQERG